MSKSKTRVIEEIGVQKQLLTIKSALIVALLGWMGANYPTDFSTLIFTVFAMFLATAIMIAIRIRKIFSLLTELDNYD